jgi:hypothetical protein
MVSAEKTPLVLCRLGQGKVWLLAQLQAVRLVACWRRDGHAHRGSSQGYQATLPALRQCQGSVAVWLYADLRSS